MAKINDIARWRTEIDLATQYREENFGKYDDGGHTKAGENIDYYEKGYCSGLYQNHDDTTTTLNFFHVVTKLMIPLLWYQNPKVTAIPLRKDSQDTVSIAREAMNYYYRQSEADIQNELAVFDAYMMNRGITKIGYTTKFGMDVPDEEKIEERKKKKPVQSFVEKSLAALGLAEDKEEAEDVETPEVNQRIVSETPYIRWVNPFRFLMDPRATCLEEAFWASEEFDKTVADLKKNSAYKNTEGLVGSNPEGDPNFGSKIPETSLDEFSVVRVYDIEYHNDGHWYRLVIAKDGEVFKELYHEARMYVMEGSQFDILEFSKHRYLQYKRSDLDKIKNLQDRFTNVMDSILEQLDRFVPKVAADVNNLQGGIGGDGWNALVNGDIGAVIPCDKNPREVISEIGLTQFKTDLRALTEEMLNIITIMTGITKSKLLGVSTADTATGETIAQGGESIRVREMNKEVRRFSRSQTKKLWQVIKQFVDLEDLNLITGESGIDLDTGELKYNWLDDIDSDTAEKLQHGQYRFDLEVGSTQISNSAVIAKRIENLISILGSGDVIALMQQQGKKVDLAEVLRLWLENNQEIVRDPARIIQDIGPNTKGLLQEDTTGGENRGGVTNGSQTNQIRALRAEAPDTLQSLTAQGR